MFKTHKNNIILQGKLRQGQNLTRIIYNGMKHKDLKRKYL